MGKGSPTETRTTTTATAIDLNAVQQLLMQNQIYRIINNASGSLILLDTSTKPKATAENNNLLTILGQQQQQQVAAPPLIIDQNSLLSAILSSAKPISVFNNSPPPVPQVSPMMIVPNGNDTNQDEKNEKKNERQDLQDFASLLSTTTDSNSNTTIQDDSAAAAAGLELENLQDDKELTNFLKDIDPTHFDFDSSMSSLSSSSSDSSRESTPEPTMMFDNSPLLDLLPISSRPQQQQQQDNNDGTVMMMTDETVNNNNKNSTESMKDEDDEDEEEENSLISKSIRKYHIDLWDTRFADLVAFKKVNGHCNVPHNFPDNRKLGRWVKRQRRQYKLLHEGRPCTMTSYRFQLLTEIGFVWDSHEIAWNEKFNELMEFKKQFGSCSVPAKYQPNKPLATWVKCQRRQYKLFMSGKGGSMTRERAEKLNEVGFEWGVKPQSVKKIRSIRKKQKLLAKKTPSLLPLSKQQLEQLQLLQLQPLAQQQTEQKQQVMQLVQQQQQQPVMKVEPQQQQLLGEGIKPDIATILQQK